MTVDTKEVVTTIAYMIGVRKSALESSYPECTETLEKLYADKEATVIRYLCKLRTVLMQKFKRTDTAIRFELKNLTSLDWYDHDNIRQLEKWGFEIIHVNYLPRNICRTSHGLRFAFSSFISSSVSSILLSVSLAVSATASP